MEIHSQLVISQTDGRPMYAQIVEQIKRLVALGEWAPGRAIPSIRQLAVDLKVSVITVKRAYQELERDGVIVTQQGKGSSVGAAPGLGPELLQAELDEHLRAILRLSQELGLSAGELAARLERLASQTPEE